ncbi:hypothetical protein PUN28_010890 [Cardiocondyla obscurior]|uniref:Uncharacterized protein n=1 Tax=Cardiocondyla obscurior TaxID=286306 RepID=A0AAW2FI86_9HYME
MVSAPACLTSEGSYEGSGAREKSIAASRKENKSTALSKKVLDEFGGTRILAIYLKLGTAVRYTNFVSVMLDANHCCKPKHQILHDLKTNESGPQTIL